MVQSHDDRWRARYGKYGGRQAVLANQKNNMARERFVPCQPGMAR